MYARICDNGRYYRSLIYGGMGYGIDRQYIVLDADRFTLVKAFDQGELAVERIQDGTQGWSSYENAQLLKHQAYFSAHGQDFPVKNLYGYPEVCENYALLAKLLNREAVPVAEAGITPRALPDADVWSYIQTQEDADAFMRLFVGFHDATLDKLCYEERDFCTSAVVTFDNRGWYGVAELCFEGVQAVKLRPSGEQFSREIFDATLLVSDEGVFWADEAMAQEDPAFDGSYIKALSLKWRKIG